MAGDPMMVVDLTTSGNAQGRGSTVALLDVVTGIITGATWQGVAVGELYGGTDQTGYTPGDILYASGLNTLARRSLGAADEVLTVDAAAFPPVPVWKPIPGSTAVYTAGENMANLGVAVYMKADGLFYLADKDSFAATAPFVGILTAAVTVGNLATAARPGSITTIRVEAGVAGLDEGQLLFIGDSGELTNDVSGFGVGDVIKAVAAVLGNIVGVHATALILDQLAIELI